MLPWASCAGGAQSQHCEVQGVNRKAVLCLGVALQRLEDFIGHLDRHPTRAARKMSVAHCGKVVGSGAVPEMGVLNHSETFQLL